MFSRMRTILLIVLCGTLLSFQLLLRSRLHEATKVANSLFAQQQKNRELIADINAQLDKQSKVLQELPIAESTLAQNSDLFARARQEMDLEKLYEDRRAEVNSKKSVALTHNCIPATPQCVTRWRKQAITTILADRSDEISSLIKELSGKNIESRRLAEVIQDEVIGTLITLYNGQRLGSQNPPRSKDVIFVPIKLIVEVAERSSEFIMDSNITVNKVELRGAQGYKNVAVLQNPIEIVNKSIKSSRSTTLTLM